ncbi:alpha/beta hydrolase domain-containing protein [Actinoplanes sp. NPDC024001]|uniref:alpha/beta hydrolase domain-containing protein n=1 Tax=Actinoplanes sp. NPDC024001 TaxID=3154598 RepID=UPI0033D51C2A
MVKHSWRSTAVAIAVVASVAVAGLPAAAQPATTGPAAVEPVAVPSVSGPLPGTVPGDPKSPDIGDTYPFFSTPDDLARRGYVEQEFLISGRADGWDTAGVRVAEDVPYTTRILVRRPARAERFNGTALVEWQNVTAGYDLDALWNADTVTRAGYAWIGVSAQRVGVDQLRGWSPARYGTLDVTGAGAYVADELSYDIFAQAAKALTASRRPLGGLKARTLLAIGASQSAARMTVYYDRVLPQVRPVFDGYGFIVGTAPARQGAEPVFQVLSETDVRSPVRPADTDRFRRWEVAGSAHSGHAGQVYRQPIQVRDLGAAPVYDCAQPPFSRVPLHHVVAASYTHLERWVRRGTPPPSAEPLAVNADGTKQRDELGLARGGIRLSQVAAPTALNSGDNSGESFCRLFGTHVPFDRAVLDRLYPSHARYVAQVVRADLRNIRAGYLLPADAAQNWREAG